MGKQLLFLSGDHLFLPHDMDKQGTIILCAEVKEFYTDIPHHKKKLVLIFSALRHHAQMLRSQGWQVDYQKLTDDKLEQVIARLCQTHDIESMTAAEPGSYALKQKIAAWADALALPLQLLENEDFLLSHQEFENWSQGRKLYRLEDFYRFMRKRTSYLMEGSKPSGGRWNYDKDNRNPAKTGMSFAKPLSFEADAMTQAVMKDVEHHFPAHFGNLETFDFAVTAENAQKALTHFIDTQLPSFGATQDAMLLGEPVLNHSLLSAYLNIGLLTPKQVCDAAQRAYEAGNAPIEAVEGFIRQIIGWREYIRGLYWLLMPEYLSSNFFDTHRDLPEFYWTTETKMTCMHEALTQTRDMAYAHHIQRLMITGNFAMLYGVDPDQIHKWYLAVYADAHEWVELPNVIGMSQFADGGVLASKPYAASGAYINRMSDYCESCVYDVSAKTGENACPFNSLYWDFLSRNEDKLKENMRLKFSFRNWHSFEKEKKENILQRASELKNSHNF